MSLGVLWAARAHRTQGVHAQRSVCFVVTGRGLSVRRGGMVSVAAGQVAAAGFQP